MLILTSLHRCCAVGAILLLSLSCAGCMVSPPLVPAFPPAGITIKPVVSQVLPLSPVAVSPDGSSLALVRREGLFLTPLSGGEQKKFSSELPVALAFNPAGTELAAAFIAEDLSRLQRFDTSSGEILGEMFFPGRCEALLSREGEWLVFVSIIETFKFGGNLRNLLWRWDGVNAPEESLLNDTTLDRSTLADSNALFSTLHPQLSPYGDEILFLRLHDPPAFDPYIDIVIRHLETGSVRLVAKLPQMTGAAVYLDVGELVVYGDGIKLVKIVDPWSEKEIGQLVRPGLHLATPPAGDLLWVDESLLHRDGQLLLGVSKGTEPVTFLADGRLLLREKGRLWLLAGLPAVPSAQPVQDAGQLQLLRKWRAEGLINVQEYAERTGK